MKTVIEIIPATAAIFLFLLQVVFWYEGDKEIQILCGEISSGVSLESAEMFLRPGSFCITKKLQTIREP